MRPCDIINRFIAPSSSYLEIGVLNGETWNQIHCARKIGVDPDSYVATHKMMSDEFFHLYNKYDPRKFDVVFVDGLHLFEQVMKDVTNSLHVLKDSGIIIIHDCVPTSMKYATEVDFGGPWFGTTWRAAVVLAFVADLDFQVILEDGCGCGLLRKGTQKTPDIPIDLALHPTYFESNYRSIFRICT